MAEAWRLKEDSGTVQLELDLPGTDVNVLTSENMKELKGILTRLAGRTDLRAVLFTSAKSRIFIAGADIKEIEGIRTRQDAFLKAESGKEVFQLIEDFPCVTVAVINGACLGGGYELALACRYRTAAASEKVKIGLPEVNLGILPGFGGSIRMPRLLGLMKSLPLILAGRMVGPKEAFKLGMVDRIFPEADLLEKSLEWVQELAASKAGRAQRNPFAVFVEKNVLGPLVLYPAARKDVLKRTKGFYPAPLRTLELIGETYGGNPESGFRKESEAFADLGATDVSKSLIKVFFLSEHYKKKAWTSVKGSLPEIRRCGVIGAGIMGGGIAQLVSYKDIPVKVKDISEKALEAALAEAGRIYDGALKRGRLTQADRDRKMGLISIRASDEEIAQSDILIEAVVEDLEIKKKVFKEWSEKTPAGMILASNTSSLSVSEMARVCRHPERVAGLHFFNPVHRMPLVEVIRAEQSSEETLERTIRFARSLGKTVILVKDAPGFLVNRLLLPYMNEAAFMIEEGLSPEVIDKVARDFGMPMGPVELVDQVGIDVGYKVAHILQDAFGERMKTASILEDVKNKGLLGKKTGRGFYLYEGKEKKPNPALTGYGAPAQQKKAGGEEIIKRLIYIMVNEAARCLDEKIIDSPGTVDIGMMMGTGFPPFRGGLLHYADSAGVAAIADDLKRLAAEYQTPRFEPSPYLLRLAGRKTGFYAR